MKRIVTITLLMLILCACAAIPTKNHPDEYTRAIVQDAIRYYRQHGRQALIDYYSSADNIDGQWYVFVRQVAHHLTVH